MAWFGWGSHGLRSQVSQRNTPRWPLLLFGGLLAVIVATVLLAPYLPSSPQSTDTPATPEPAVMAKASKTILDGAEWSYKAMLPPVAPPAPESNGQTPLPAPALEPSHAPTVLAPAPVVPRQSDADRRRLADEEARRRKQQRQEYEAEIKKWKPLTWGQTSKATASGQTGQVIPAERYSLSPGELIPCQTEPVLSNEAPGAFRVFVTAHVYDSKTHRHVIIPQGTEINGQVGGRTVIFGDSRLPIEMMTMKFPTGDWLTLGKVSVGDRYGTAGLTGDIDRHYGRIIASIFLNSALRGGTTAIMAHGVDQGVTDRMGAAAITETAREGQQLTKQVLRTDPTITIPAGEGCQILTQAPITLTKPFTVAATPGGQR